jgi:hypothetical protein
MLSRSLVTQVPWLRWGPRWGPSIRYATVCVCINYVPVVFGRVLNTVWRTLACLARLLTTLARLLIKLRLFDFFCGGAGLGVLPKNQKEFRVTSEMYQ